FQSFGPPLLWHTRGANSTERHRCRLTTPSFLSRGTRIPQDQIWKLVAYIKSLNTPREADPPR
ncbi:MAG: hypothetical protein ACRD8A_15420, partial [Candidatus Acidiferrales bacterium]